MLVKLQGSGSAVGAEVEALSGNHPAETAIVIEKSVVIGEGRVEAGREMIMIETNLGKGDGPDEYICTVQNDHKYRVVALSFLGTGASEHFIFDGWQGCTMILVEVRSSSFGIHYAMRHTEKTMFPYSALWSSKLYNCRESHERL